MSTGQASAFLTGQGLRIGTHGEVTAETFDIYIEPPRGRYRGVLRSAFEALVDQGWELVRLTIHSKGSVDEQVPGSVDLLLKAESAIASFQGADSRWIELGAGFNRLGRIELGSDQLFFESGGDSFEEIKMLFSRMRLSAWTSVVGDVESLLNRTVGIARPGVWKLKDLGSDARLRRFGFFWIDQLTPHQWARLRKLAPEVGEGQLAVVGETHIVRMWENPYLRASVAPKLRALAREVGST